MSRPVDTKNMFSNICPPNGVRVSLHYSQTIPSWCKILISLLVLRLVQRLLSNQRISFITLKHLYWPRIALYNVTISIASTTSVHGKVFLVLLSAWAGVERRGGDNQMTAPKIVDSSERVGPLSTSNRSPSRFPCSRSS